MLKTDVNRNRKKLTVLMAGLAICAATIRADGPGHSFTTLTSPYTQELFGVTVSTVDAGFLGGVAFAPDGDVWAGECWGSQLHRFDRDATMSDGHGGTVHPESLVDLTAYPWPPVGCGVVNSPVTYSGYETLFANTWSGLWPINASNGLPILGGPVNSAWENAGSGRGIDIDPAPSAATHIVYVGADCDPSMGEATSCTLWDYNTLIAPNTRAFARFARTATESFESLHFSPDGSHVFVSYRDTGAGSQGLAVIARPASLMDQGEFNDQQVVRRIPMASMPQGIAFRAAGDFAVTLNEDGTMTRLTFPSPGFTGVPVQASFASGGFRGGLLQVGADGCIYAPQGRMDGGVNGTRFSDDAESTSDSVVRVCGGFAPGPGVAGAAWGATTPGSISGSAFADWNRNSTQDAGEPGLAGVAISLTGPASASASTGSNGAFTLPNVAEGQYSVSAPMTVGALSTDPTPLAVTVNAGQLAGGVDFPYTESMQPECTTAVQSGSPTRVRFTLRDRHSGVRRVMLRALSNFQASVNGGSPMSGPGAVSFPTPATTDVDVTATRNSETQAATAAVDVEDTFGNVATCATTIPASAVPPPPQPPQPPPGETNGTTIRKELSGRGRVDVEIAHRLAHTMRHVTVRNGRQGLEGVDVYVNHHRYRLRNLRNGQVRTLDVGRWLVKGKKNKIVLVGWGRHHDSAVVTISDRP